MYAIADKTRFHIVRETDTRPRLQCMDCRWLDRMDTHAKNRPTMEGMVQGWFMTHKAFVLMKKVHLLMDKDKEKSRLQTSDEWGEARTALSAAPLHLTATGNSFALGIQQPEAVVL